MGNASHREAAAKLPRTPPEHPEAPCEPRQIKDIVVVAWIDPDNVALSTAGVDKIILQYYPPDGNVPWRQKADTLAHMGMLSFAGAVHPLLYRGLTRAERHYILHWMFKHGSNPPPPDSFANDKALDAFVDKPTNFKLFNHVRVGHYVSGNGPAALLRGTALIGVTHSPISLFNYFLKEVPGVAEPDNGKAWLEGRKVHHLNKGNPDKMAVKAFDTLASDLKLKWVFIASTIIQSLDAVCDGEVKNENYPTYWIYERICDVGQDTVYALKDKRVQAPTPEKHLVPTGGGLVGGGGKSGGGGASGSW